jgi:hypothetical protein
MSLTQSLLPVVALMAARAVSATAGKGESNSENSVEKCPVFIQRFGSGVGIKVMLGAGFADPDCGKLDPNPHYSQNTGALEAQNGAMECLKRSQWRRGASKWSC